MLSVSSWDIYLTRWYSSPLTGLKWSLLCLCSEYIISSRNNHIDQQVHREWWTSKWWNAISSDVSSYCPRLNSVPASPSQYILEFGELRRRKSIHWGWRRKNDPWKFRAWRVLILYFATSSRERDPILFILSLIEMLTCSVLRIITINWLEKNTFILLAKGRFQKIKMEI